jgi:hypothetical protein
MDIKLAGHLEKVFDFAVENNKADTFTLQVPTIRALMQVSAIACAMSDPSADCGDCGPCRALAALDVALQSEIRRYIS